jgi:hypothetical protein
MPRHDDTPSRAGSRDSVPGPFGLNFFNDIETMLNGLLHAHSGLRYLVPLAGVAALLYSLFAVLTRRPYDRGMRITAATFTGLLHLQILLGFFLLVSGRFDPQLIGHIFMMLLAVAATQIPLSVLKRRPPEERTPLPHLIGTVVALALIWGGILSIGRTLF